jgi:hypothetical protein
MSGSEAWIFMLGGDLIVTVISFTTLGLAYLHIELATLGFTHLHIGLSFSGLVSKS